MNKGILLIIILCIILFIILCIGSKSVSNTPIEEINNIYKLLQNIHLLFEKEKIEYIMTGGTLLGAVRHQGIIPWDNDADLIVLNEEPDNLLLVLNNNLQKYNIVSKKHIKGNLIQVYFKNHPKTMIDIFFVNKKSNKYTYRFPYNIQYNKEYFLHDEIYPIKTYKFGELILYGPNNPFNYLTRTYNDYNTISKWNSKNYLNINGIMNMFV